MELPRYGPVMYVQMVLEWVCCGLEMYNVNYVL